MRQHFRYYLVTAAICLPAVAPFNLAMAQTEASGSLYPTDLAAPVQVIATTDSVQTKPTQRKPQAAREVIGDPGLTKALGPAGYLLNPMDVSEEFSSAIRYAVGRHPAYHAQISALDETRFERRRARAALYPQLSTQLRGDYSLARDFDPNTDNAVEALRPREQFSAGISASQLVFDGGATFQRIKSARARNAEFENSLTARTNDLALASLTAYHDFATHQALVALGEAFIARHTKILNDVRERERLGAGSKADVTRAIARLAAAQARVSEIRESKQFAEIRYLELFAETTGTLQRPSFDVFIADTRDQVVTEALNQSPDIAAATARTDASRADYKAAKGARLPEIRVSVDAIKYDVFDSGNDFDVRAGVNLSYNIFGGGSRAADISQAASRTRQSQFSEDQIRQEVARDAALAFERVEGASFRLRALETAVIAHDETRELVLERYRVARGDLIDVLQAENDYFEAGVSYLTGLANRDMAVYGVMEHTGDLIRFFSPQGEFASQTSEVGNG